MIELNYILLCNGMNVVWKKLSRDWKVVSSSHEINLLCKIQGGA